MQKEMGAKGLIALLIYAVFLIGKYHKIINRNFRLSQQGILK
jgi:hypothetical protein